MGKNKFAPRISQAGKYKAVKTEYQGESFDSKKELNRWLELRRLEAAGRIYGLERQKEFVLIPAQTRMGTRIVTRKGKTVAQTVEKVVERKASYVADFVYVDAVTQETVVEDTKGYKKGTAYAVFVLKRKLMLERYNIRVVEV